MISFNESAIRITKFSIIVVFAAFFATNIVVNLGSPISDRDTPVWNKQNQNTNCTTQACITRNSEKLSQITVEYNSLETGDGRNLPSGRNESGIYNYFHPGSRNETPLRHAEGIRQKRNAIQSNEDLFEFMVRIADTPTEWERIRRVLSRIKYEEDDHRDENATINDSKNITTKSAVMPAYLRKQHSEHFNFNRSTTTNNNNNDNHKQPNGTKSSPSIVKDTGWPPNQWIKRQDDAAFPKIQQELLYDEQQELNFYEDTYNDHNDNDVELSRLMTGQSTETPTASSSEPVEDDSFSDIFEDYLSAENKYNVISSVPMVNSPSSNDTFQLKVYKHIGPPNLADNNFGDNASINDTSHRHRKALRKNRKRHRKNKQRETIDTESSVQ